MENSILLPITGALTLGNIWRQCALRIYCVIEIEILSIVGESHGDKKYILPDIKMNVFIFLNKQVRSMIISYPDNHLLEQKYIFWCLCLKKWSVVLDSKLFIKHFQIVFENLVCYENTGSIFIIIVLLGTINPFQIHFCWNKWKLQAISLLNKHRCCLAPAGEQCIEESFFGSSQEERERRERPQGQL